MQSCVGQRCVLLHKTAYVSLLSHNATILTYLMTRRMKNFFFFFQMNYLNDTHKQLMVHWVGEGSNVIICLARDPNSSPSLVHVGPSAVYISYDYGDSYNNKTDLFKLSNGSYAILEKFYNHPKYNTHVSQQ
jgi:hypothetical protein